MAFDDLFRLSSHAVIVNDENKILLLKATYTDKRWGLPGGSLEPGETIHEALIRECKEEIGLDVKIIYLSGIYFHSQFNSHVCIFRCTIPPNSSIELSSEHSEYKYFSLNELSPVQQHRMKDCLEFDGEIKSAKF